MSRRCEVPLLRMRIYLSQLLALGLLTIATQLSAAEIWNSRSFTIDPAGLRQAADSIKAAKHAEVTILLNDLQFSFDQSGCLLETRHLIYRLENQHGVENWSEVSGRWEAWHQSKPEIRARVITTDGAEHWLDPKTLTDFPVHENAPELYTDARRFGGPLPAIAIGAIVEREVVIRDTAPLFAAGSVHNWVLGYSVPVNKTHIVVSHPDSLPLHYQVHLLPEATVSKSHDDPNSIETITLDQGPLSAFPEPPDHLPADAVVLPEIEFATGRSWQQVAAEYARLTNEKVRFPDVQPLLAKVNLKGASQNEVIRRLLAALHKNVRYTGIEFGESSLIPQFPSETLKRKYGDCKDKALLLVAMLRASGVPADLALLQAGPGRDINPELPGMGNFDHAIVYVPPSASGPDLWIDATAQYSQAGTLPWMDYGRSALIVSDQTESLKKTPELTAQQNLHRELRIFTLAEYGHANIAEIDEESGPEEADYRQYYLGDTKEVHQNSESYVQNMYLADSLISLEHEDLSDLDKSPSIKFVAKGKRGNTDLEHAVVAIRVEGLFDRLPKFFLIPENEKQASTEQVPEDSDKPRPRHADWSIIPFTTEWQYKITAPIGFKIRALPSNKTEKVNSITFSQQYSANPEGTVVEATLRVESTATRMTALEANNLRDATVKARDSDPILITFDSIGGSLISAGKIKEGIAAYRQISSQHPKEALHKVQLAQALLSAGLGEQARVMARQATTLEPDSALAFSTLATVLKHDRIGRLIKKGMDFDGAVAAYKKAVALDPKDTETRANLALLLEYDAEGNRYSESAPLKDAVDQLLELKKLDEDYSRTYDDNILYNLWYARDYQRMLDLAKTLPTSDVRKGLTLAAIALLEGSDAALKKSVEITTSNENRSHVLMNAGAVLLRVRKYPEAGAIFAAAAQGQANESQVARSAAIFAKTRPYSELQMDANDPRAVVQQIFGDMLSGRLTLEEMTSLTYVDPQTPDSSMDKEEFKAMMSSLTGQMKAAADLPLATIADLAVSNIHYTVDGDDSIGYKITVEAPGAAAQDVFVLRDGGHYKIAAFSVSDSSAPQDIAYVVLRELQNKNLPAARKWLDRARDRIHMGGGDDPLDGAVFPHFWTKAQEADAATIRTAALVLLPSRQLKNQYLSDLIAARDAAGNDLDRARLNLTLANGYFAQQRWAEMLPITLELTKAYPTSLRAYILAASAYAGLKRLDDWDKLVQQRMKDHPDEMAYLRSDAELFAFRGQFAKSREILKTIADKGQATSGDMNQYAWYALLVPGPIEQETIDIALRANDLAKNNFALLHTLGCVYAQAGKPSQARELLLNAMDAARLEEPNSEVWFGFGLIAEQYGQTDAAQEMFARVEKPKMEFPAATYDLAQGHLAALRNSAPKLASSGSN